MYIKKQYHTSCAPYSKRATRSYLCLARPFTRLFAASITCFAARRFAVLCECDVFFCMTPAFDPMPASIPRKFINALAAGLGLRTSGKPTVFPILPLRENKVFSRPLSCSNPSPAVNRFATFCGTWIRTKIHCSRGSSPTIRRSRNTRRHLAMRVTIL